MRAPAEVAPVSERFAHGIVWLRRDLRLDDNAALHAAATRCEQVTCAFVLDPDLLRGPRMGAPIVQFFFDSLGALREELRELGSDLALREGGFARELGLLAKHVGAEALFYNADDDPAMRARDAEVTRELEAQGLQVHASLDLTLTAARDVLTDAGKPYTVYTPYRKRWNARLAEHPPQPYPSKRTARGRFAAASTIGPTREVPRPEAYGHASSDRFPRGGRAHGLTLLHAFVERHLHDYADERNRPDLDRTSHLSPHLRAGTIGIREAYVAAHEARAKGRDAGGVDTWIGELTWRDFYQQLLVNIPRVANEPFVEAAQAIRWRDDEAGWTAWTEGRTGYPIVDAAMVQLNTTGWMHNRLRMIVAAFLTKDQLIDYRHGERYFETHLADADLGANNGGWQWSASTGTDAAPYFRVFNPTLQGKKFDPDGAFVRTMLPALANVPDRYVHEPASMPPLVAAEAGCVIGRDYPEPIVDHAAARERALEVFGRALSRT